VLDLNFITAIIYLAASAGAWVAARRAMRAAADNAPNIDGWPKMLLWIGLVTHALAILWAMFDGDTPGFNIGFSHSISLIVWVTLVSYVVVGSDARLTRLANLYLAPVGAFAASLVVWLPAKRHIDYGTIELAFGAHIVVGVLAYALFTVAALHALLILFLQRQLLAGVIENQHDSLPPLMRIEKLMFQLLWIAFVLLTGTIISGMLFSEELFGKPYQINHKNVFSLMSWLVFGGLLAGHVFAGWRGKLAVRWTLIGFVMLLLSYAGSKFVLEVILKRV
jgi:ABC-type uncharacterized transport system permease subunit